MEFVAPVVALVVGIAVVIAACIHLHSLPEAKAYARARSADMYTVRTPAGARLSLYDAPPVAPITDRGEDKHQPTGDDIHAALLKKCSQAVCLACGEPVSKGVKRCKACTAAHNSAAMSAFLKKM